MVLDQGLCSGPSARFSFHLNLTKIFLEPCFSCYSKPTSSSHHLEFSQWRFLFFMFPVNNLRYIWNSWQFNFWGVSMSCYPHIAWTNSLNRFHRCRILLPFNAELLVIAQVVSRCCYHRFHDNGFYTYLLSVCVCTRFHWRTLRFYLFNFTWMLAIC